MKIINLLVKDNLLRYQRDGFKLRRISVHFTQYVYGNAKEKLVAAGDFDFVPD